MSEKLCVFCKHWSFYGGSPGYSEMTPGSDASMDCTKGHYGRGFDLMDISGEEGFRALIKKAETCKDYKPAVKPGDAAPQGSTEKK